MSEFYSLHIVGPKTRQNSLADLKLLGESEEDSATAPA